MGKKDVNYITIKKENNVLEQVLNKYNPILSARDIQIVNLNENEESKGFVYTEEDHSYDETGL
ncbi:MAG: hypothetical protein K0R09_1832 [Clostridiales bacterium]|nr:hypothetical protein [Clostridiales bacterium]